jgi:hypothetical protein
VGHLQRRSGKIVAIKVSNYVKQEHIRQKPQRNPTASAASNGNVIGNNGWAHNFLSVKIGLVGQSTLPEISRDYIPVPARVERGGKITVANRR